jgi:dipeptidyl aminopeptidase/acylaminoacyl peptidase
MIVYRRFVLVSLCALLVLCSSRIVSANGFSLEQVLSSPFPSDMIASRQGDRVAWVFNEQGRRNIWVAEAPGFVGRRLTNYSEDDGQEITEPTFSPDGSLIAYVRGGAPNADRESPNPTSDPAGARQEVWVVNVRTGAHRKIGEGVSPMFSPRGDRVMFIKDDQYWWSSIGAPAAKAAAGASSARKMFEIRGEVSSAEWSPDGSKLAFVSSRRDHSFIVIYDPKRGTLVFLEPSVDRDIEPRWSPDGKRIAFIRLFSVPDTLSADHERLLPWAIRVVDISSRSGKEIWRSGKSEMDSFSRLPLGDNQLQWAAGGRLVFASEKDGWAHLYSVPSTGGEEALLTPGNYEVENAAWSRDRDYLIVASNEGDIDHRHLWKVATAGGQPSQLTQGDSIEMYPLVVDRGTKIAFLSATAKEPLLPYISSISGKETRPLATKALPAGFPAVELSAAEQLIVDSADGFKIHCQLFKPKNPAGKMPAIVFMHGGPIRQMLPTWHYGYYYHNAYALNQYLASRGYLVLSVNYRCGIGYGRAFREAKHRGPRGASEYQDIVAAAKYLRDRNDVDSKRIGLWGGSYGGFLTAMGLARNSDLFAAGVDIHGVHDWSARFAGGGARPPATQDLVKLARESSPISFVDKWRSPVLLIHGDDDRNVAFSQTVDLVRKLRERGVEFEQLIFPDEIHDFLRHQTWLRVYHAAADFFDRKLK